MRTLIIPCAGKSSRFPGMRPKWLLTHPDGKLMIEKAVEKIYLSTFGRVIITILREHVEQENASLILSQVFEGMGIEVLVLDSPTSSPAETVALTLEQAQVKGPFVVKDSDNSVELTSIQDDNFVVGLDIHTHSNVRNLPSKSFLSVNDQNIVVDIVEKRIVSNHICLGVYGFSGPYLFFEAMDALKMSHSNSEIYISHIIAYLIGIKRSTFRMYTANSFEDWGTLEDWRDTQAHYTTYFCDLDGVIFKNVGRYGLTNWSDKPIPLLDNIEALQRRIRSGARIVFTSARPNALRGSLIRELNELGFTDYELLLDCYHSPRVLINDFAPTNPYPSAQAINLPRDGRLKDYL